LLKKEVENSEKKRLAIEVNSDMNPNGVLYYKNEIQK
jgi:hypothetical protein